MGAKGRKKSPRRRGAGTVEEIIRRLTQIRGRAIPQKVNQSGAHLEFLRMRRWLTFYRLFCLCRFWGPYGFYSPAMVRGAGGVRGVFCKARFPEGQDIFAAWGKTANKQGATARRKETSRATSAQGSG